MPEELLPEERNDAVFWEQGYPISPILRSIRDKDVEGSQILLTDEKSSQIVKEPFDAFEATMESKIDKMMMEMKAQRAQMEVELKAQRVQMEMNSIQMQMEMEAQRAQMELKLRLEAEKRDSVLESLCITSQYSIICSEAFRKLEFTFSKSLKEVAESACLNDWADKLAPFVFYAGDELHLSTSSSKWWMEEVAFGTFADALRRIVDMAEKLETEQDKYLAYVHALLMESRPIFFQVVSGGVLALQRLAPADGSGISEEEDAAFNFMGDEANFSKVVREFSDMARIRDTRNEAAHPYPFKDDAHRTGVLNIYNFLVSRKFCENFRHVALLSGLQIRLAATKDKGKRPVPPLSDKLFQLLKHEVNAGP